MLKNFTLNNRPGIPKVHGSALPFLAVLSHGSNSNCHVSRVEYRPLEGFVLAVSPFNFTAIGGNLPGSLYRCSFPFHLAHNH